MRVFMNGNEVEVLVSKELSDWYEKSYITVYVEKCANKNMGNYFYARMTAWDEISYLSVKGENFEESLRNLKKRVESFIKAEAWK